MRPKRGSSGALGTASAVKMEADMVLRCEVMLCKREDAVALAVEVDVEDEEDEAEVVVEEESCW